MNKRIHPKFLKWAGLFGHTFAVFEPDPNIPDGWRVCAETSYLADAMRYAKPGQRIYEKTSTKPVRWKEVTMCAPCARRK